MTKPRSAFPLLEPLPVVFTILTDGREKQPYRFQGLCADAKLDHRPLAVHWEWAHLKTGDYSIKGCEDLVAIERKSLEDLYSTLGQHRDRFEEEHRRMAGFTFAAVVIEASWERILRSPPRRSRLLPKAVFRTHLSWQIRYGVPWLPMEDRRLAELATYRLLEKWWFQMQAVIGEKSPNCRICGRPLSDHDSIQQGMGPVCAARGDRPLWKSFENSGRRKNHGPAS